MRIIQCEQGTPAWYEARAGRVTASKISDLLAKTKTGWGASRQNYLADLVVERLTGTCVEGFSSPAMQWGKEKEPEARIAYQFFRDAEVQEVGFVLHPELDLSGCSPDGLVGSDGMVEIKCPSSATHIETLLGAGTPEKYLKQMQWQMRCCDRQWCDFVSFDPRLPTRMQLFVERVKRDDLAIAEIEAAVIIFLKEVAAKTNALNAKYGEAVAA
jgi:putative phage-type endonuclease